MFRTSNQNGKNNFSFHFSRKTFLRLIIVLFFLGLLYGAVLSSASSQDTLDKLSFVTQGFMSKRAEQSLFYTFFNSLASSAILLLLLFVFGFSAIAQPVSLLVPVFRGLGLGVSMGYFYLNDGFKGAAFCLLLIVPQALISTLALVLGTRESIRFSNTFFSILLPKKEIETDGAFRLYFTKFGVLFCILLIAAVIDCICTFLFAGFFS